MLMDSKRIEELLARYWECETSLEEEQQLHQYFQQKDIPEQWKETAALFKYFQQQKKKSITDVSFDDQVLASVPKAKGKTISFFYITMRIAAGVAVLMVAIWFIRKEVRSTNPPETIDTYEDPKLAFEETKKALMMISKSFGKAEEQAKKINLFNEAQDEIRKKEKSTKM